MIELLDYPNKYNSKRGLGDGEARETQEEISEQRKSQEDSSTRGSAGQEIDQETERAVRLAGWWQDAPQDKEKMNPLWLYCWE